jgi:hypothetical protein
VTGRWRISFRKPEGSRPVAAAAGVPFAAEESCVSDISLVFCLELVIFEGLPAGKLLLSSVVIDSMC